MNKWLVARIMLNCISAGILFSAAMQYLAGNGRSAASKALGIMLYAIIFAMVASAVTVALSPPGPRENMAGCFIQGILMAGMLNFLRALNRKSKENVSETKPQ